MEKGMPHVTTEMECPLLKEKETIGLDVNVFRSPDHGGLDVTSCSEFADGKVTCEKGCIHTQEAHVLHKQEVQKHQVELKEIGPDVLG